MNANATARPRLRRPQDGRILAGLAVGLARHLGIDVVVVRVLLVVLAVITNGLVALAYVVVIFLVPVGEPDVRAGTASGSDSEAASRWSAPGERDPQFWLGVGLLVLGAVWLLSSPRVGPFVPGGNVLVPLALIGFGLALWRSGDRDGSSPDRAAPGQPTVPPPPPSDLPAAPFAPFAADDQTQQIETQEIIMSTPPATPAAPRGPAVGSPPPAADPLAPAWRPPPVPEPRRSLLTRLTLGIALVTAGALWAADLAGALELTFFRVAAALLLVIGIGTVVGSFVGRSRTIIVVGALLLPVVLLAGVTNSLELSPWTWVGSDARVDRVVVPASVEQLESSYQVDAGRIELDLRDLDLDGDRIAIDVRIGAGEIVVRVPEDVGLVVEADAGLGRVDVVGRASREGIAPSQTWSRPADDGSGTIVLDLSAGVGNIEVRETATS